ncbi:NrdA [Synechococcus phage S-SKS1]|uniref:Ribonucleoside-diphosphate reductase n=1 Tax=Synechococcus phage S-SKS1 TaxID=754042 RepID=M4QRV5_9CAUD|nr:ribonucleotide reductase large subunit [Synechococcus phage S-SKS1]AGH31598.1 NrdA [Synechococcus phage S-SKS1]
MEKNMTNGTKVTKRNGKNEPLDLNKLHVMVEEACKDLAGVSASQVEIQSGIQFYDGITTDEIQEILIRSASDLVSLDHPNYQFVAARLLLFAVRKQLYGRMHETPTVKEQVEQCVAKEVYDAEILDLYSDEEFDKLQSFIDHDRDYLFTYAGLRQVCDKYLVQDRINGKVYETPQFMYLLIAATIFSKYPKDTRLDYVRKYYDAISRHKINIPTPIMAGVRTPLRQYASCVLVDVDDTLRSIESSDAAIFRYVAARAGIGINAGRIRGINSRIRGGEVIHTGVVPFLKKFESTVRSCTQNGIRGGSATVHFPIWHIEIEDILVLKNNKGTEDNRVRKLDYSIQISKLFYERFIKNEQISLFSPNDVPGLYDAFGTDAFDSCYVDYESDQSVPRKTIGAQELFFDLLKERAETGRIYIMNIDHCNSHSSFMDKIEMSNLCQEITLPTKPLQHIDDENGEIALCILSAINIGKIRDLEDLDVLCDLAVRSLDELIDFQGYPVRAAEIATRARRSLGIGYIGLAHYLAKNGHRYEDPEAWKSVHDLTEAFQYYLIQATVNLAKEKGACEYSHRTKYGNGILPIDTYKNDVDEIVPNELHYDWESLRSQVNQYGVRNSTLSAQMPSESSSVVSNATNGIEPPRGYLSIKKSKKGPLKQIVPQYGTLKNNYDLLWEMRSNKGYINIVAVMQKFFDQAISGNWSYNPEHYPNNEIPVSIMAQDLLTTYKYGWKTSYYQNTYDIKTDEMDDSNESLDSLISQLETAEEEDCESCKI